MERIDATSSGFRMMRPCLTPDGVRAIVEGRVKPTKEGDDGPFLLVRKGDGFEAYLEDELKCL